MPIFQFAIKNAALASPLFFFLLLLQWSFWEWKGVFLWILPLYKARYIPFLKPKQQLKTHKRAGNRTVAQKMQNFWSPGDARPYALDTRPCVSHHGPWWTPWADRGELSLPWFRCFLNAAFWASFGPPDLPWIFLFWANGLPFQHLFTCLGFKPHISPKNLARNMLIYNQNSTKPKSSLIGVIHA